MDLEFLLEAAGVCITNVVCVIVDEEDTLAVVVVVIGEVTLMNDKKKSRENTSLWGSRRANVLWLALAGFNLNNLLSLGEIGAEEEDGFFIETIQGELLEEDFMVDDIEGGRKIEKEGGDQLVTFGCGEPDAIQLYEGRDGAVVGKATMVIGVEQVVDDEVLENLVKDSIFYKFTHLWYMRDWAVIFS